MVVLRCAHQRCEAILSAKVYGGAANIRQVKKILKGRIIEQIQTKKSYEKIMK